MANELEKKWKQRIIGNALYNSIKYGKALPEKVLQSLFKEGLKKQDIKEIMPLIKKEVDRINSLSEEKRKKEFEKFEEKFEEIEKEKEKKSRREMPELKDVKEGQIITRIAPEPSKYNHIGHAFSFLLNYYYAKKYKGKCKLRFEDCNPEKVSQEYVDAMKEDVLKYLGIQVSSIKFVSDDIPKLYRYAEKLIEKGNAYMCDCKKEEISKLRREGKECSCRYKDIEKNLEEWKKFIGGRIRKKVILRLKGNMLSDNGVMRDPILFREIKKEHYRHGRKYKVWPTYDFYNAIEDSMMNVTHIFRSNEFALRNELQNYLRELLGLKKPEIIQYGRINVLGAITKGREIREKIEKKEYLGWDDPRLMTLRALKRRGIVKETFYELIKKIGLNQQQSNLDFEFLASINRKIIDKEAERYSFCKEPIKLNLREIPIKEVFVKIHPEKNKKRKIKVKGIYISREDFENYEGKEVRLMHLFNVKLKKDSVIITGTENKKIPKINWVSDFVNVRILMDNAEWISGIAEIAIKNLKLGQIIQFERFGFCRFDRINEMGEYEFWFTHR